MASAKNCQTIEMYLIQLKLHFPQESTNKEQGITEEHVQENRNNM